MKTAALALVMLLFSFTYSEKSSGPGLKGKKILIVYGGWEGHEPVKFVGILYPWLLSEGAVADTCSSLEKYTDKEYMKTVDLVIQVFTMSEITTAQEEGLLEAVRNGTGIAGWHGGLANSFRNNPSYQYMVGGQWVAHPGGVIDYTVNISDTDDPVTKGISDFKMHSEQYYMHIDPNVKVLATTTFSGEHDFWAAGCIIPVAWKKMYGKGRVFYTSLGHVAADMQVPEALEIIKRGIRWSAVSKYEPAEKWVSPVY